MPDSGVFIGQTFSHYRIIEKLGAGGMGVVYKAEDTRLQRFVALKFLPDEVVGDTTALSRFRREAQAASSLNHPHICTIHDIGEQDGQSFIAMELLEGQTLKDRIGQRPLPLETLLDLALQIADALEVAHGKSIVHRDVKPSNIFVTNRGDIKLVDFGLAKHVRIESLATADAPTMSGSLTIPGQIVGTIAYMSPEQVQDKDVDSRSDIFSFGAVMYEMATGRRAFTGASAATLIAEILRGQPKPVRDLNPELPEELQRIVAKALEKDRADRYQTANDVMVDLRRLRRQVLGSSQTDVTVPQPGRGSGWSRRKSVWIPAIVGAAALLALTVSISMSSTVVNSLSSEQLTFSNEPKDGPIVTDGTRVYFRSSGHSVEMSVKGGPMAPLGAALSGMRILDISPDASELLALKPVLNDESGRGTIWTVATLGGYPKRLGNLTALGASWSPDGRSIAYGELNSVFVSDASGENLKEIWNAKHTVEGWLHFSPDSRRIRATVDGPGASDPTKIWDMNVDGSNVHPLTLDWPETAPQWDGQWTPDGKHFVLMSVYEGLGNIYEVVERPWFQFWKKPTAARLTSGQMAVVSMTPSRDSTGLFAAGKILQGSLQVYDSKENRFVPYMGGLNASLLLVSPDRKWMIYADYPRHYLWRSKLDGSEKVQLTSMYSWMPQWSPDSKTIAFSDGNEIYQVSIDGGAPEKLTSEGNGEIGPSWWPDGKSIVFNDFIGPGHFTGLKVLDLATRKISVMPESNDYYVPSWSPDGQYMVAAAHPSRMVVYSAKTGTWKNLKNFHAPSGFWVWANDSKSLYIAMLPSEAGAEPGPGAEPGIYRLTIANAKWELAAKFNGVNLSSDYRENFPGLNPDGQLVMMSDTGVVQIYSMKWTKPSDSH